PRTGDAALVVERLPEQERGGERLSRRRARLCRHPHQRRLHLLLTEVVVDDLAVRPHDGAQRPAPVPAKGAVQEEAASQLEGRWGGEKGLQYQPGEGAPVVQEAAIGVPLPGELPLQLLCRALRVTMDEEGVPVGVRGEEEGVQLEVFEPIALQLQLLDHGGEADEDVRAAAEVESV